MDHIPQEMYDDFRDIIQNDPGTQIMVMESVGKNIRKNARILIRNGLDKKQVADLFVSAASKIQNEAEINRWTNDYVMRDISGKYDRIREIIMSVRI